MQGLLRQASESLAGRIVYLELLIVRRDTKSAFEFKYTSTPKITRSMHSALEDLELDGITIIYPGNETYPLSEKIRVTTLQQLAGNAGQL